MPLPLNATVGSQDSERTLQKGKPLSGLAFGDFSLTPIYRPPSATTVSAGRFASGQQGAQEITQQHAILRGIHQALHSAIGEIFLSYHHVKGHSTCMWNELADAAAKLSLRHVRFHRRQRFDLQRWSDVIPHLWLLLRDNHRDPRLFQSCLAVPPPDLPHPHAVLQQPFPVSYITDKQGKRCEFLFSAASANVLTLGSGDSGFTGKAHYLQEQFASLAFNFVGIQEARTKEGTVTGKGPYYRLCSGHQCGHHGVELWISKTHPLGYIGKKTSTCHQGQPHCALEGPTQTADLC